MKLINNPEVKEIEVKEPQILTEMATETPVKDITQMSAKEIKDFLKEQNAKEKQKNIDDKKALSELEDEFIDKYLDKLIDRHNSVEGIVKNMFKDFEDIKPLKAEVRGAKIENQYSHTFTSSTKDKSITIGYNTTPCFDGSEAESIAIIKNLINVAFVPLSCFFQHALKRRSQLHIKVLLV